MCHIFLLGRKNYKIDGLVPDIKCFYHLSFQYFWDCQLTIYKNWLTNCDLSAADLYLTAKEKKTISCYFLGIIFVDCVNDIRKTSRAWFFNQVIWMCFMWVIIFCCIFSYRYIHDWTRVWSFRSRTEKRYWKTENCIV